MSILWWKKPNSEFHRFTAFLRNKGSTTILGKIHLSIQRSLLIENFIYWSKSRPIDRKVHISIEKLWFTWLALKKKRQEEVRFVLSFWYLLLAQFPTAFHVKNFFFFLSWMSSHSHFSAIIFICSDSSSLDSNSLVRTLISDHNDLNIENSHSDCLSVFKNHLILFSIDNDQCGQIFTKVIKICKWAIR